MPCVGLFRWHWRDSAYSYVLPWLGLSVPGSGKLVSTLENTFNWIQRGQSRFLCICFILVSFVDLQMHIVIIFVLITSVVVYFCSRLPADPKYLDVLKTRVHFILCHLLNLITDYYFGTSSSSIIGTVPVQKAQTYGGARAMACSPMPKVGGAAAPCSPCSNAHAYRLTLQCCS